MLQSEAVQKAAAESLFGAVNLANTVFSACTANPKSYGLSQRLVDLTGRVVCTNEDKGKWQWSDQNVHRFEDEHPTTSPLPSEYARQKCTGGVTLHSVNNAVLEQLLTTSVPLTAPLLTNINESTLFNFPVLDVTAHNDVLGLRSLTEHVKFSRGLDGAGVRKRVRSSSVSDQLLAAYDRRKFNTEDSSPADDVFCGDDEDSSFSVRPG